MTKRCAHDRRRPGESETPKWLARHSEPRRRLHRRDGAQARSAPDQADRRWKRVRRGDLCPSRQVSACLSARRSSTARRRASCRSRRPSRSRSVRTQRAAFFATTPTTTVSTMTPTNRTWAGSSEDSEETEMANFEFDPARRRSLTPTKSTTKTNSASTRSDSLTANKAPAIIAP